MAERAVSAKDVLFWIDPAGGTAYRLVGCLTDNSFAGTTNTVDSSSKCGDSSVPGTKSSSWNLALQLIELPDIEETTGLAKISGPELYELWKNDTIFSYFCGPAVPVEGSWTLTGTGYFSSFNWNNQNGNASEVTGTVTNSETPTSTVASAESE